MTFMNKVNQVFLEHYRLCVEKTFKSFITFDYNSTSRNES